jgi:hypothetical protein
MFPVVQFRNQYVSWIETFKSDNYANDNAREWTNGLTAAELNNLRTKPMFTYQDTMRGCWLLAEIECTGRISACMQCGVKHETLNTVLRDFTVFLTEATC